MQNPAGRFVLAASLWPRQGYDFGNRSQVPAPGPTQGRIMAQFALPTPAEGTPERAYKYGGIAVLPDATLRVAYAGMVTALTPDGTILWTQELVDTGEEDDESHPMYHSAPVALATGEVVISLPHSYIVISREGTVHLQQKMDGNDDSRYAPNLTPQGALILTSMFGEIRLVVDTQPQEMEPTFGYDIVPPAVYADGSLAVAGYYGTGFCRVQIDGQFCWRTNFHEADLLSTVNHQDIAAVGSVNDQCSRLFSPTGQQIGEYSRAAVFASQGEELWLARSGAHLAQLNAFGQVQWEQELPVINHPELSQPITDNQGRIYLATEQGVTAWDASGRQLFHLPSGPTLPHSLALIAPATLACLAAGNLLLIR